MSKSKKQAIVPLTRWRYFTETLYKDPTESAEFQYDTIIYIKSDELMDIEEGNKKINWLLLLILFATFAISAKFQNIWLIAAYLIVAVVGEIWRWQRLPKDIMAHLTDSGRRKK